MQKISPGEFHVLEGRYVIKTRLAPDAVTDDMVAERVRIANLDVGDSIDVLACDHAYQRVIAFCRYMVIERESEFVRVEIDDNERQSEKFRHTIYMTLPWVFPGQKAAKPKAA